MVVRSCGCSIECKPAPLSTGLKHSPQRTFWTGLQHSLVMPGYKQRIDAESASGTAKVPETDSLSSALLTLWCTGELSAIALQKLANAALLEGVKSKRMLELGRLGTWGQHTSNVHRDLVRLCSKDVRLPEASSITVPCLDSKRNPPLWQEDMPIIFPHILIASLAKDYPHQYEALLGIKDTIAFWSGVSEDDPRMQDNPLPLDARGSCVPLWLHGDGVEFSTDSLLVFSFGSVLCSQSSLDSVFMIAAWPKSATTDKKQHPLQTWDEVFRAIAWSFTAMWHGKHPTSDWRGRPIQDGSAGKPIVPDGRRFCLWQLVGDLEYYANVLNLPHWGRDEFCWLCNCSKKVAGRSPADVRDQPGWSMLTLDQMRAHPASQHPFFRDIPGPVANLRPALDVLHTVDLGYAASLCGSALHCWAYPDGASSRSAPSRLAAAWESIQAAYVRLDSRDRLSNLVLSMFTSPTSPWSSPPDLKTHAAEMRHLVPALAVVARSRSRESETDAHISAALEHLARFYLECDAQAAHVFVRRATRKRQKKGKKKKHTKRKTGGKQVERGEDETRGERKNNNIRRCS